LERVECMELPPDCLAYRSVSASVGPLVGHCATAMLQAVIHVLP